MTRNQKIHLCTGANNWQTASFPELGIPSLTMSDGTNGVRFQRPRNNPNTGNLYHATINFSFDNEDALSHTYEATCFPSGSALACSWSPELAREIGACIASECKARGIGLLLGPGMNIRRHPLTARNFEYYSEDPCLSGEMAAGMIQGIQAEGVGACVKHFACNNSDTRRTRLNCLVEPRALREIYLAGFERAIKKGKPAAVMGSYNQINGTQACENQWLLTDVLRKEWGFEGVVLSDWGAVKDSSRAAIAGLDLQMPRSLQYLDTVKRALDSGLMTEQILDEHCARILSLVLEYSREGKTKDEVNWQKHHAIARKAACESAVLLKNEENILPIDVTQKPSIAIIGDLAKNPLFQGTGCAIVNAKQRDIPLDEICKAAPECVITYAKGYESDRISTTKKLLEEAARAAETADVAIVLAGTGLPGESDDYDHKDMNLPPAQLQLLETVCSVQKQVIVLTFCGNSICMPWASHVSAILSMGYCGEGGGKAVADLLFGNAFPGGKLAATIPVTISDTPAYLDFPHEQDTCYYREGIFVGYRYYDKKERPPLFPFGYGQTYTTFSCSDLQVQEQADHGGWTVSLTVTNTGKRTGSQIVQLYIAPEASCVFRPEKELKAFAKVLLAPNEKRKVIFLLEERDFAYYNTNQNQWQTESGSYWIRAGFDSTHLPESRPVIISRTSSPRPLSLDSHYTDIFSHPAAKTVFLDFLLEQELITRKQAADPLLTQELSKTFWGFAQHLDMNSFGRITPTMSAELLKRMNEALLASTC